jgi:23S rRNA pseudouridine2605 synthase/16S rRNA pseudouridine516 synthase
MAKAGIASRRKCEQYILDGRVKVNEEIVRTLGVKVNALEDEIEVDGKPLDFSRERVYILINKPAGYLTTVTDPFNRPTVLDLLHLPKAGLFPVGRLDRNSEGILLLTNDGELAYRLTHPRFEVERTYLAKVRGHPEERILDCLRRGIILEDGLTSPAKVKLLERTKDSSILEIVIKEGRKRQVRRMFEKVGHPVINLKRISIGPLKLGSLNSGNYRPLTSSEIYLLQKAVALC